ncbi:MAG: hypothetical protein KAT58_10000 [candidate division Zixibacteria bacterium]|nr:hypothetical protein [candidate division Zixibacteria bacterium]
MPGYLEVTCRCPLAFEKEFYAFLKEKGADDIQVTRENEWICCRVIA